MDFRADISEVPDQAVNGRIYDAFDISFFLDPNGARTGSDIFDFVRFEAIFGTSLGSSDLTADVARGSTRVSSAATRTGFRPSIIRADISGDEIFTRLFVTDGALDVIRTETTFFANGESNPISVDVSQVSAVPLPASLVLLLSGVGAFGLIGRRRRSA